MSEYVTHDDSGVLPGPEFQRQQIVTNETMYRLYNRVARENYSGLTQFATGYIYNYVYIYICDFHGRAMLATACAGCQCVIPALLSLAPVSPLLFL